MEITPEQVQDLYEGSVEITPEQVQDMPPHQFPKAQLEGVYRAIRERRDIRHFQSTPIPANQLVRFIEAAHMGPSVGFMQPWRFIRIVDPALRQSIHAHVNDERLRTAKALDQRCDEFMQLKVEGILACAEVLVVGLVDKRENYIFGRRTMPEMDLASTACAIQNFWLAARAEGIGVGWVSMFDPEKLRLTCDMPDGSYPMAILCVGHVDTFYAKPMLETTGWDRRRDLSGIVYQDEWGNHESSLWQGPRC